MIEMRARLVAQLKRQYFFRKSDVAFHLRSSEE